MARIDADPGRFHVTCAGYTMECTPNGLPLIYDGLKEHAALVEEIELHERNTCCLTVRRGGERWPFLVVAQSYAPYGAGFEPGALLVPETRVLFLGAGDAELGFASWSLAGQKRWAMFVEPPWDYTVKGEPTIAASAGGARHAS